MSANDNRGPGRHPRNRGGDYISNYNHNVVRLPLHRNRSTPFARLTWRLMLDQHQRGVLNPAVLEYLMAGVGLHP